MKTSSGSLITVLLSIAWPAVAEPSRVFSGGESPLRQGWREHTDESQSAPAQLAGQAWRIEDDDDSGAEWRSYEVTLTSDERDRARREGFTYRWRIRIPEETGEPTRAVGTEVALQLNNGGGKLRFMRRWLLGEDDVVHELDPLPDPLTDEVMRQHQYTADWTDQQLQCSPDGQVMLMKGEKSVFEINAGIERKLREEREAAWRELNANQRRELVRKAIWPGEFNFPQGEKSAANAKPIAAIQRDEYRIEKVILAGDDHQLALPGLLFVPETVSKPPVLYLHGESMKGEAQPRGGIEELVKDGHVVLSAELSGIGETETGHDKQDYGRGLFGPDSQEIYLAYLMGRSFVGMRTTDVFRWSEFLSRHGSKDEAVPIRMIASGEAAVPALHAAVLETSRFESVHLSGMIRSWVEVVAAPESLNQLANAVHGALRHYDLPDLVELAETTPVEITRAVDPLGELIP